MKRASARDVLASAATLRASPLKKFDDEQQIVFGEVYAPGIPDSQGDFMTEPTIREMAYRFMKNGFVSKIDVQHNQIESGCYVVESFLAREDDPVFIPGSWVLGVKIPSVDLWKAVKSGNLNGFSLDGLAVRESKTLELEIPEVMKGECLSTDGHTHTFAVKFDEGGNFAGGRTSTAADGHFHEIIRGTMTEVTAGHSHRFSFVEGFINA